MMINFRENRDKFSTLQSRMDDDLNLYYLESYILRGENKQELKHVSSITLNDPHVFGNAYLSIMQSDKRTVDITGVDATNQNIIEREFNNWLYVNDDALSDQMIEPLDFCIDWFAGFRGWIGALCLMYKDGDSYLPNIMPLDPRWMLWETGSRGLKWASYRITMDKAQAEERYKINLNNTKKNIEIECYWDDKDYYMVEASSDGDSGIGSTLFHQEHNLGHCPIILLPVPTQPMVISSGDFATSLSKQGESIYAPVRELIPKMNEVASVWATINKQQFMTPLAYVGGRDMSNANIYGYGIVVQLQEGEQLIEIPTKEMSASAQHLFMQLFARWERATLSSVNYGQAGDRQSALAIADLKSDRDKIIVPRRKAKSKMYRKILESLRRQITGKCYTTKLTDHEKENAISIDTSLYKDKFTINIGFDSISPQENIANAQLAMDYKNLGYPMSWIARNINRVDNPEELLREAKQERLRNILPTIDLAEAIIEWSPGEVTQKKINGLLAKLGIKALEDVLKQQMPLGEAPNPASQPKQPINPINPSSQKLASMQEERTGQQSMTTAKRANNMRVENG